MSATELRVERFSNQALAKTATLTAFVLLLLASANRDIARAQEPRSPEPHTQAVVIADDEAWEKAEESGDTAYIDALLLPEYRSVNVDGSSNNKATILALAKKYAGSTERATLINKWRAAHPYLMSVEIAGDTAVLTFTLNKPDGSKGIMSCDIFVYREGRWRGLYSQHTQAEA
jgi:hypothetical protein